jgi:nitrogen fixation/metabolism regulation signal transduction histidine kinase
LYGWDPSGHPQTETGADQARLEVSLEEGLPMILGDPTQLRQVIHNLLANARDALVDRAGDGVIEVKTQLAPTKGPDGAELQAVRLTVSDNGSGFTTQILNRAFEPYVTTKAHGTGLGLAIVRKIIEEHGGHIDISNRKAGGARVSILLTRLAGQLDGKQQQNDNKHT